MAFEPGPQYDYLAQLDSRRGLCIPFSSELRRSEDFFDQETYEVYLHEYKHVGATIGLFDNFYEGTEYILMVTGVANEQHGYQGLTLVSDILGDDNIATIAAAGLLPDDDGSDDRLSSGDRLQVQQISVDLDKTQDVKSFVKKAQVALDRSPLASVRIRSKLAEMSVYLQKKLGFPLVTKEVLQAMYEQAANEVECEDSGTEIANLMMFDTRTFGDYRRLAETVRTKFNKFGARNLNSRQILTDFTRLPVENPHICPSCGEALTSGMLHSCATSHQS